MASFRIQQEKIVEYIENNYANYLPNDLKQFELTLEFLDFDKYKKDFTLFIDFARIDFRQSNYKDDCEDIEHLAVTIYLVHRNNKSEILQANNLDSAYAFYEMIKDKPSLGVSENTTIESIDFYNWAEGNKFLVVSEISLSLETGL
jgi:hypothetical protein